LRRLVETIRKGGQAATEIRADHAANSASAATTVRPSQSARAPIVAAGSAEFEAVRALLARHVGPIAKVLVEKAAAQAQTTDDLCERLATHVRTPADRTSFLKAARTELARKG
jgi:serine/threonine-protein kinase